MGKCKNKLNLVWELTELEKDLARFKKKVMTKVPKG